MCRCPPRDPATKRNPAAPANRCRAGSSRHNGRELRRGWCRRRGARPDRLPANTRRRPSTRAWCHRVRGPSHPAACRWTRSRHGGIRHPTVARPLPHPACPRGRARHSGNSSPALPPASVRYRPGRGGTGARVRALPSSPLATVRSSHRAVRKAARRFRRDGASVPTARDCRRRCRFPLCVHRHRAADNGPIAFWWPRRRSRRSRRAT